MTLILSTPEEILAILGRRVREQRLLQELPQRELAQMAGLSLGAVRKLEATGHSSLGTLVRVMQALGAGQLSAIRTNIHRGHAAGGCGRSASACATPQEA